MKSGIITVLTISTRFSTTFRVIGSSFSMVSRENTFCGGHRLHRHNLSAQLPIFPLPSFVYPVFFFLTSTRRINTITGEGHPTMTDHAGEKKRKPRNKFVDRRSGEDRRQSYNLDNFSNGGSERRTSDERRRDRERRAGWIRELGRAHV